MDLFGGMFKSSAEKRKELDEEIKYLKGACERARSRGDGQFAMKLESDLKENERQRLAMMKNSRTEYSGGNKSSTRDSISLDPHEERELYSRLFS